MIEKIFLLAFVMMLPLIEMRFGIPLGILNNELNLPLGISISGFGLPPFLVFILAVIMGFLLAVILFNLLHLLDNPLKKSKISRHYFKLLERTQKKIHPYINKYGTFGLAIYIFIPIPGTGVYIGSLGGYILGFEKKKFYLAAFFGVLGEAILITFLTLLGKSFF